MSNDLMNGCGAQACPLNWPSLGLAAGLGLMSMQERVHLVHGLLSVESAPGKGTQVLAIAPLDGQHLRDQGTDLTANMTEMA